MIFKNLLSSLAIALFAGSPATGGDAIIRFTDTDKNVVDGRHIQVPTDTWGTWTVVYTIGDEGMAKDGGIWIKKYGWWDANLGTIKQIEDPKGEDYVTCSTASETGRVEIVARDLGRYFKEQHMLHAVVSDGKLAEGDQIVINVGDRSQGGPGTITSPVSWNKREIYVQVDSKGDGDYTNLPEPLLIDFLPGAAKRFEVVVPSIATTSDTITIIARAEDIGSNVQPGYAGAALATFQDESGQVMANADLRFTMPVTFNKGMGEAKVLFDKPGVYYVHVLDDRNKLTGMSNPIWVMTDRIRNAPRLYWGDTHVHTYESDGTDDLDTNYLFARDISRLDFCCMSDHLKPIKDGVEVIGMVRKGEANNIRRPMTLEQWWDNMCDSADRFNAPGKFVTFYAYEWSGGSNIGGDHIPILSERRELPGPGDLNELYRMLESWDRGNNVMIIPHVGGRIGNWDWHSPQVEIAAEVASVHGHFEWFGQEALQRGYKVGFMGSGDNHYGRPGYSIWASFGRMGFKKRNYGLPNAISGVYTDELTRAGIIGAFRQRRVIATTGHRPIITFTIDNSHMGQEMSTNQPPKIRTDIHGTAEVDRVDVIRNKKRIHTYRGRDLHETFEFKDTTPPVGHNYYYLRIRQKDGEIAWTSPIFVNYTGQDTGAAQREKQPAWNDDGKLEDWLAAKKRVPKDCIEDISKILQQRAPGRFSEIQQIEWVENPRGSYAVFFAKDKEWKKSMVRIRYYPGFAEPRLHVYPGLGDYGPIRK
jgi:hypothetical protein